MKKVFVSGCFDMLHSGHVAFLQDASSFGELYVGIGSDSTVEELKNRKTVNPEQERQYMVEALRFVERCYINSGSGYLDFINELQEVQPDIFVVNEDGDSVDKKTLCQELGIEYIVRKRVPYSELPRRSTTDIRNDNLAEKAIKDL